MRIDPVGGLSGSFRLLRTPTACAKAIAVAQALSQSEGGSDFFARRSPDASGRRRVTQNLSVNTVLTSGSDSTVMDPLCICMIWRDRLRPMPEPLRLVV